MGACELAALQDGSLTLKGVSHSSQDNSFTLHPFTEKTKAKVQVGWAE